MRKNILYVASILALGLTASCNKIVDTPEGDDLISFAPQAIGTKAMVNNETGLQSQAFDVIDLVDGELFIDNTVAYNENGWAYTRPADAKYLWKDGAHKLFGYTSGIGTFEGTTLTLGSRTITTAEADQVDLLYSDIVSTTAKAWKESGKAKGDPVPLHFHHLLSAISLTMQNYTANTVTLNSVTVSAPNKGSATVSFAGTAPVVTPGAVTVDGIFGSFTPGALASKARLDVFGGAVLAEGATPEARMIWPQTLAAGTATITVNFTNGSKTTEKTVNLPVATWAAGKVNAYNIQIYPDELRLNFTIEEWQESTNVINASAGSINMSNVTWMNTKVDLNGNGIYGEIITEDEKVVLNENTLQDSDYQVMMFHNPKLEGGTTYSGYYPASAFFTVYYPASGQYKIGMIPAYGETEVDENAYVIKIWDGDSWEVQPADGQAITHDTIYFQIHAAAGPYTAERKAQVDIWFKPEGSVEWISAYSEIRANYACVIPAVN